MLHGTNSLRGLITALVRGTDPQGIQDAGAMDCSRRVDPRYIYAERNALFQRPQTNPSLASLNLMVLQLKGYSRCPPHTYHFHNTLHSASVRRFRGLLWKLRRRLESQNGDWGRGDDTVRAFRKKYVGVNLKEALTQRSPDDICLIHCRRHSFKSS